MARIIPNGITQVRLIRAKALAGETGGPREMYEIAKHRYGEHDHSTRILKGAIGAGGLNGGWGDQLAEAQQAQAELVELAMQGSIIGRLASLRRVPFNVAVPRVIDGAASSWVAEGKGKPVSRATFDRVTIGPTKLASIAVVTKELLQTSSPKADMAMRDILVNALRTNENATFVDPSNAGVADRKPASITYGAPSFASTGDIADDIERLIANFQGDLDNAAFLLHPLTATQIGLRAGVAGIACDIGARGGMLAGLPAVTSSQVAADTSGGLVVLADCSGIILAEDDGINVKVSDQVALEMSDNPSADGLAGTGAAMVPMWQVNSVAVMVERAVNWLVAREGAVVTLTGASYPAAA